MKKGVASNLMVICLAKKFCLICQLESIRTLEQFIIKHRKDYVDMRRTTEQERDSIEHEVSSGIKSSRGLCFI